MTSLPMPTPQAHMAAWMAAVPLLWATAYSMLCQAAKSCSNSRVTSESDIPPRRRTDRTASSSSAVMMGQVKMSPASDWTA